MFKKFKLLFLIIILMPINVYALSDTYTINTDGNDKYLYSTYPTTTTTTLGYYTKKECANKGGTVNESVTSYEWINYKSVCTFNITGTEGASCNKSVCSQASGDNQATAIGSTLDAAKKACLNKLSTKTVKCCINSKFATNFVIKNYLKQSKYFTYSTGINKKVTSATNPSPDEGLYSKGQIVYQCTAKKNVPNANKSLIQRKYKTSDGNEAYCLEPGKTFNNNKSSDTYKLISTYTLNCPNNSSKNANEYCQLAAAFKLAKEKNASYLATLTALRFVMAYNNKGNGYWDGTNLNDRAPIYSNTVNYIISNGYSGSTTDPGNYIIFAHSDTISDLQLAIEIFKQVVITGVTIETPKVNHIFSSYNSYTKTATLEFESNFPSGTEITSIELSNGKVIPASNITTGACENGSTGLCITATLQLEASECAKVTAVVKYKNNKDVISKIGYYQSTTDPWNFQDMYVFDQNSEATVKVTNGKTTNNNQSSQEFEICAPDNSCTIVPGGTYICKNGNTCSKTQFDQECGEPTDNSKCPKPELEENMPDDCDDSTTGRIEDATMCNILNAEDKYKEEYKTTNGNDYCTIYCRETLIFSFMDKETAYAGQAFQHSVGSYYSGKGYLSTVILSKKQCASEIDYDSWLVKYKAADDKVLSTWNTLKEWEAFYNLNNGKYTDYEEDDGCDADHCGCSAGAIIYMEWSLAYFNTTSSSGYTSMSGTHSKTRSSSSSRCSSGGHSCRCCCETDEEGHTTCGTEWCETCSCSCATDADSGYVSRNYASALTAYKNALDARDKLLYQIQDCNFMSDNNNNNRGITTTAVYTKTKYGPYDTSTASGKYTTPASLKTYNAVVKDYKPGNKVEIDYEENYGYGENYDVDIVNEQTKNYAVTIGYSDKETWKEYCKGDCDGTLYDLSTSPYLTNEEDNINYWNCTGSETSAKCTKNTLVIPKNKLANIVVETETVHYQDAQFYTQVFTGKASTTKTNDGYWITLDEHIYPVSTYRLSGNYGITLDYSNIGESGKSSNRNMSDGSYTCSYDVINEVTKYDCNDGYHICYPCNGKEEDCDGYNYNTSYGLYFRTISLSDIFPNSSFSPIYSNLNRNTRNIGQNWLTTNAIQVINEIQKNGENVWTNKEPMYTIRLSRDAMKSIREYNSLYNYLNYSINCDSSLRCTSDFLTEFQSKYSNLYSKNLNIPSNNLYYYKRSW